MHDVALRHWPARHGGLHRVACPSRRVVGSIDHGVAVVLHHHAAAGVQRVLPSVRGPHRLNARVVDDQVAVGLHDAYPRRLPGGVRGPQRCPATGAVEHEVAVGLVHEGVAAIPRGDRLPGVQHLAGLHDVALRHRPRRQRVEVLLELGSARYVLATATGGGAGHRHAAGALQHEVGLATHENTFDLVGRAVEHRRARVAAVGVEVGHEKRGRRVVPHCGPGGELGRQP